MSVQTLHDTGDLHQISSKMDGAVYQTATTDCVVGGVGDEFTINYSLDSLNVSFDAGSEAIIGGAFFKITSLEAITLVANSTIYLCANIDLSRPNGQTGAFVQRTSTNMQSDNINGSGTSRDLLLYVITTGANGVTNVSDRRNIVTSVGEIIDALSAVAKSGSYNDLSNKPTIGDGTLTIQRNGSNVATFKANATGNVTANISVPTATSQLSNNSGYIKGMTNTVLYQHANSGDKYTGCGQSYTATQDCWAIGFGYEISGAWFNGIALTEWNEVAGSRNMLGPVFLKAGQSFSFSCVAFGSIKVFAAG